MSCSEEESHDELPEVEQELVEPEVSETVANQLDPEEHADHLLAEVEKYKDQALRAEAEMQNVRRRVEKDVANAHKFGLERFVNNILPVVDGLEKTLENATEKADPVIEGVELTFKLLLDVLAKESVNVIDPTGEPFDPNLHEAMSMVENPDMEPNSVFAVVQKGYVLNDRLVRPAMVIVSKAPVDK